MTAKELLVQDAEYAWKELSQTLEGVKEAQAWSILPNLGGDYLHTDGSIQGIALHIAGCKFMYGSISFLNTEIRWREIAEQMDTFEPSWPAALDYLNRAHQYWMASWADLTNADLELPRPTNYDRDLPAWEMIRIVSLHDCYHAGQIAMLRFAAPETTTPPPSSAEDVRQYCRDSKAW